MEKCPKCGYRCGVNGGACTRNYERLRGTKRAANKVHHTEAEVSQEFLAAQLERVEEQRRIQEAEQCRRMSTRFACR